VAHKWWTGNEIDQCKQLYESGKTIEEVAEVLDRGVISIVVVLTMEGAIKNEK
jgi:hypothetical protein